jgi:hydroxymethylglutaryl-CoA reductase
MPSSELKEFYKKTKAERIALVKDFAGMSESDLLALEKNLDFETANRMVENCLGTFSLPYGIATNFKINGKDYLIPLAIEEPSVIAAASNAAKLCRDSGFQASADEPIMLGQVQIVGVKDFAKAKSEIEKNKAQILQLANAQDPTLVKFGGGAKEVEVKAVGKFLVVLLSVDVRDAMGANAVNTMCEAIAPTLEELSGGKVRLRILTNLAVKRLVRAKAVWSKKTLEEAAKGELKGEDSVDAILDAYEFAEADVYRACTNNKGIMNGIDAVAIACGQDWRAIEAGAHAFASLSGKYSPLAKFSKNANGDLVGEIELPLAVGLVGGAAKTHPLAQLSLKIIGVKSGQELAQIIACVGLANNFAALRALATTGIQAGHMKLHAKNVAVMAGAKGEQIDKIAARMIEEKNVRFARAQELLKDLAA